MKKVSLLVFFFAGISVANAATDAPMGPDSPTVIRVVTTPDRLPKLSMRPNLLPQTIQAPDMQLHNVEAGYVELIHQIEEVEKSLKTLRKTVQQYKDSALSSLIQTAAAHHPLIAKEVVSGIVEPLEGVVALFDQLESAIDGKDGSNASARLVAQFVDPEKSLEIRKRVLEVWKKLAKFKDPENKSIPGEVALALRGIPEFRNEDMGALNGLVEMSERMSKTFKHLELSLLKITGYTIGEPYGPSYYVEGHPDKKFESQRKALHQKRLDEIAAGKGRKGFLKVAQQAVGSPARASAAALTLGVIGTTTYLLYKKSKTQTPATAPAK